MNDIPDNISTNMSINMSINKVQTDWEKLRQLTDAEIHAALEADPEIYPTDEAFWQNAKVVMPRNQTIVTFQLDADSPEQLHHESVKQPQI